MFISSYNTYIQTNTSTRNEKQKEDGGGSSFTSKLFEQPKLQLFSFTSLPVDYVQNTKSSRNKFAIEKQTQKLQDSKNDELYKQEKLTKKVSTQQTLQSAKTAYKDNAKLFSQIQKTKITLDQTPKVDPKLPENIQELKEQNMRRIMVNTYIQDDNYYKRTA